MSVIYQIRSDSIIEFYKPDKKFPPSLAQLLNRQKLSERKTYTGIITPGSKKRLTRALENLVNASVPKRYYDVACGRERNYNLIFITLTIHSPLKMIKGREARKTCLEPFILWLHRKQDVKLLLWKAELQGRGQLHYHITCDNFVDYRDIRNKWNELQARAGYLDNYYQEHGHYDANSTDVHAVRSQENIIGYLKKKIFTYSQSLVNEVSKGLQNEETIGGKIWDCSLKLKSIGYFEVNADGSTANKIRQTLKEKKGDEIAAKKCRIYKFKDVRAYMMLVYYDRLRYYEHLENLRNYKRDPIKKQIDDIFASPVKKEPPKQLKLFDYS